jgi:hypothetical protein
MDISAADAGGAALIIGETPGVEVQLATLARGRLLLRPGITAGRKEPPRTLELGGTQLGSRHPQSLLNGGHRSMVVAMALAFGPRHLTGLRNRRALLEELPRARERSSEEEPTFLWFWDERLPELAAFAHR